MTTAVECAHASAALQHDDRLGRYTGGPAPCGYRLAADGVHLEPRAVELEVILETKSHEASHGS